jgi:hypothetical protein
MKQARPARAIPGIATQSHNLQGRGVWKHLQVHKRKSATCKCAKGCRHLRCRSARRPQTRRRPRHWNRLPNARWQFHLGEGEPPQHAGNMPAKTHCMQTYLHTPLASRRLIRRAARQTDKWTDRQTRTPRTSTCTGVSGSHSTAPCAGLATACRSVGSSSVVTYLHSTISASSKSADGGSYEAALGGQAPEAKRVSFFPGVFFFLAKRAKGGQAQEAKRRTHSMACTHASRAMQAWNGSERWIVQWSAWHCAAPGWTVQRPFAKCPFAQDHRVRRVLGGR